MPNKNRAIRMGRNHSPQNPQNQSLKHSGQGRAHIEQLQATKARELAQAESAKASRLSTYSDVVLKWIPALSLSYGFVVAFMYFFGEINFFPAGVNVGDALLLLFIALGYGLLSFFFVGHGLILMTAATVFREKLKTEDRSNLLKWRLLQYCAIGPMVPVVMAGLLKGIDFYALKNEINTPEAAFWIALILLLLIAFRTLANARSSALRLSNNDVALTDDQSSPGTWQFIVLGDLALQSLLYWLAQLGAMIAVLLFEMQGVLYVSFASLAGFMFVVGMEQIDRNTAAQSSKDELSPQKKAIILATIAGFSALLPMFWDSSQGNRGIAKAVFEKLGLRTSDATLHVSAKVLTTLTENAKISNTNLHVCLMPDSTALVAPVDVLWHGMGRTSLVELAGKNSSKIEIPSEDIQLIRNQKSRCHDLGQSIHFTSGGKEPVQKLELASMKMELIATLGNLPSASQKAPGWLVEKIVVTGNTDPLPFGESGNEFLAQSRAERIIDELKSIDELKQRATPDVFQIVANGARAPVGNCSTAVDRKYLSECHSTNRRVNVRLIFRPVAITKSSKS